MRREAPKAACCGWRLLLWSARRSMVHAQNTGNITGKVIDAATLQPIPKVHVASNTGGPGGQFVGTLTGPDGSYLLEDVPAGSILMTINLDGYKLINGHSEPSAAFPLAAGDTVRRDFHAASARQNLWQADRSRYRQGDHRPHRFGRPERVRSRPYVFRPESRRAEGR